MGLGVWVKHAFKRVRSFGTQIDRGMETWKDPIFHHGTGVDYCQPRLFTPWAPALEVLERTDDLEVRFELPECRNEDVDVSFCGGTLTISGERKASADGQLLVQEHSQGPFRRTLRFEAEGVPESPERMMRVADVSIESGLLEVTILKGGLAPAPILVSTL